MFTGGKPQEDGLRWDRNGLGWVGAGVLSQCSPDGMYRLCAPERFNRISLRQRAEGLFLTGRLADSAVDVKVFRLG